MMSLLLITGILLFYKVNYAQQTTPTEVGPPGFVLSPPGIMPNLHQNNDEMRSLAALQPAPKQQKDTGCLTPDHDACDEICKLDNFWYGHCEIWDGRNFGCHCFQYEHPLRGAVCSRSTHNNCANDCFKRGEIYGGFCYPHPTLDRPSGEPRCNCFKPVKT